MPSGTRRGYGGAMLPISRRQSKIRSLTPDELRAELANPRAAGNKEELMRSMFGAMSEEEVDKLERRINEMNERIEDGDEPL